MTLDAASQIAVITYPFLVLLIAWLARTSFMDLKHGITDEAAARIKTIEDEAVVRAKAVETEGLSRSAAILAMRAEFSVILERNAKDISVIEERVNRLQREIDKDYINFDRMTIMLAPIKEAQERMQSSISHIVDKVDDLQIRQRNRNGDSERT